MRNCVKPWKTINFVLLNGWWIYELLSKIESLKFGITNQFSIDNLCVNSILFRRDHQVATVMDARATKKAIKHKFSIRPSSFTTKLADKCSRIRENRVNRRSRFVKIYVSREKKRQNSIQTVCRQFHPENVSRKLFLHISRMQRSKTHLTLKVK